MNFGNSPSVPVKISNINHGLQQAQGLLTLSEDAIELEFELRDAFVGVIKSDLKTVSLPYRHLESITLKKGWFGSKIILEGVSMKVFEDVPGTEVASCTLEVQRKHKKEAESLISKARMQLSEYKLDQMDDG